ncbi:MAG: hypothetical protein ACLFUF_08475, partial [Opitutales bacterium]
IEIHHMHADGKNGSPWESHSNDPGVKPVPTILVESGFIPRFPGTLAAVPQQQSLLRGGALHP